MGISTCKRCSVTRVNLLVKAYRQAHQNGHSPVFQGLRQVVACATRNGFPSAGSLLHPGMSERDLRALCWNVSSFLQDSDLEACLGWSVPTPGVR